MKKSYLLSYNEMIACTEDICNRYTDTYIYPVYSEFKKLNKVDFKDLHLVNSREYKQLVACELPEKIIEMTNTIIDRFQRIFRNQIHVTFFKILDHLSVKTILG